MDSTVFLLRTLENVKLVTGQRLLDWPKHCPALVSVFVDDRNVDTSDFELRGRHWSWLHRRVVRHYVGVTILDAASLPGTWLLSFQCVHHPAVGSAAPQFRPLRSFWFSKWTSQAGTSYWCVRPNPTPSNTPRSSARLEDGSSGTATKSRDMPPVGLADSQHELL